MKIAADKGDYFLLAVGVGYTPFANKLFNTFFKGEPFGGEITVAGRAVSDLNAFYLPDLTGLRIGDLKILSGGETRGLEEKTFAEFTFPELSEIFPQLKQSDVLILDHLNFDHELEPHENMAFLELKSQLVYRKYNNFWTIYLVEGRYDVKTRRKESATA